jgi:hypothetical protein
MTIAARAAGSSNERVTPWRRQNITAGGCAKGYGTAGEKWDRRICTALMRFAVRSPEQRGQHSQQTGDEVVGFPIALQRRLDAFVLHA